MEGGSAVSVVIATHHTRPERHGTCAQHEQRVRATAPPNVRATLMEGVLPALSNRSAFPSSPTSLPPARMRCLTITTPFSCAVM